MSDEPVFETTDRTAIVFCICISLLFVIGTICATIESVCAPKVCPKCQEVQIEGKKSD